MSFWFLTWSWPLRANLLKVVRLVMFRFGMVGVGLEFLISRVLFLHHYDEAADWLIDDCWPHSSSRDSRMRLLLVMNVDIDWCLTEGECWCWCWCLTEGECWCWCWCLTEGECSCWCWCLTEGPRCRHRRLVTGGRKWDMTIQWVFAHQITYLLQT